VDSSQSTIEVHRLVQVVIREQMDPDLRARTQRLVLDILVAANPKDTDEPAAWPQYAELWPHVAAWAVESDALDVRLLVADMVRYLWRSGDRVTSRELSERAIARWTPVFGENNVRTLNALNNVANSSRLAGDFAEATKLDEQILARRRAAQGRNHPAEPSWNPPWTRWWRPSARIIRRRSGRETIWR
jgi:hypothetical protein